MKFINLLLLLSCVLLYGCGDKIDGSSFETYQSSLDKIKSTLSESQNDSLSLCIGAIIEKSGYGLLQLESISKSFDGMSADDIFSKGGKIITRMRFELDSLRTAFVADSIKLFKEQGHWELKHFVDEFQEATDNGYLQISAKGVFTNSATAGSELNAKLLVTEEDHQIQLFLYEYGDNPVTNYSSSSSQKYKVSLLNDSEKIRLSGYMYEDRISFEKKYQDQFLEMIKNGGSVKVLVEEVSRYSNGTSYLFEMNTSNFEKAMGKLVQG